MKGIGLQMVLIVLLSCKETPESVKTGFEGKLMPEFTLLLKDSTTYIRSSLIPMGEPIVLIYFTPICPYCKVELRDIVKNIKKLKGIQFYWITNWSLNDVNIVSRYFHLDEIANIHIGRDYKGFIQSYFDVSGVPFTVIYSRNKKLSAAYKGILEAQQIRQLVGE